MLANESAVLCPSAFSQMMISEYLSNNDWKAQIEVFRGEYKQRRDAAQDAMKEFLPDLTTTNPGGGFYLWVDLPKNINSKTMLPRAVENLVAYTPGTAFYGNGTGQEYLRISYSYPTPENIRVGVERLAKTINEELSTIKG